ncbi:MAG TPA: hypothetical protein VM143_09880 [Acidimicrobiales bacterium]|nr:hypothetical protein [Acidimicrobiales bacterium]
MPDDVPATSVAQSGEMPRALIFSSSITVAQIHSPAKTRVRHHEFGAIIRGVARLLGEQPSADQWRDLGRPVNSAV